MIYDVDYFIRKFEAIPEKDWGTGWFELNGMKCAMGHCGMSVELASKLNGGLSTVRILNNEGMSLYEILNKIAPEDNGNPFQCISRLNDNGWFGKYRQSTPKERILAALYDIKKIQQPESKPKEIIRYVFPSRNL